MFPVGLQGVSSSHIARLGPWVMYAGCTCPMNGERKCLNIVQAVAEQRVDTCGLLRKSPSTAVLYKQSDSRVIIWAWARTGLINGVSQRDIHETRSGFRCY